MHPLHHRDQERLHYKTKRDSYIRTLPQWKKRTQRWPLASTPSIMEHFLGTLTLVLPHRGLCRAQLLGLWFWQGRGEGLPTTSTQILADYSPSCRAQPAALLICKTKSVVHSDQGPWQGTGLSDLSPNWGVLLTPELGLPHPGWRAEPQLHPLWCGVWTPTPSDREGWWKHLEALQPSNAWAKRQAGRADCSQSSGPV